MIKEKQKEEKLKSIYDRENFKPLKYGYSIYKIWFELLYLLYCNIAHSVFQQTPGAGSVEKLDIAMKIAL